MDRKHPVRLEALLQEIISMETEVPGSSRSVKETYEVVCDITKRMNLEKPYHDI